MSDMQISVGFRRKAGMHMVINAFGQIIVYCLLNKMPASFRFQNYYPAFLFIYRIVRCFLRDLDIVGMVLLE